MQQMLIYTILCMQYKVAVTVLNTDNEETAAVTMETSEDTEACKVVLVTQWRREFKLNVVLQSRYSQL